MQSNEKKPTISRHYRWHLQDLAQIKQNLFIGTIYVEAASLADSYRILCLYLPDCRPFYKVENEPELSEAEKYFLQQKPWLLYV